jgi:hypothetical protein
MNLPETQLPKDVGALSVLERERSEIQAAVFIAHKFPRDTKAAMEEIKTSFSNVTMAELAEYKYERSSAEVTGASVDLAREVARIWKNLKHGFKIIELSTTHVTLKGYCHDLENNSFVELEDKFEKKAQRKDKASGKTIWIDINERDLRELINRRGAILVRNCIIHAMPRYVIDTAVMQARQTIKKSPPKPNDLVNVTTLEKLIKAFEPFGVSCSDIENSMKAPITDMTYEKYDGFRAIYKQIETGEAQASDYFPSIKKSEAE